VFRYSINCHLDLRIAFGSIDKGCQRHPYLARLGQGVGMPREIVGKELRFSLRHAPCAHLCRYCSISESRKRSALPFARLEALVHRFHD